MVGAIRTRCCAGCVREPPGAVVVVRTRPALAVGQLRACDSLKPRGGTRAGTGRTNAVREVRAGLGLVGLTRTRTGAVAFYHAIWTELLDPARRALPVRRGRAWRRLVFSQQTWCRAVGQGQVAQAVGRVRTRRADNV